MIFLRRRIIVLLMALCWYSSPAMSAEIDLVSRSGFDTIGNGPSSEPDINADGRIIAYVSGAENWSIVILAPGTGTPIRISLSSIETAVSWKMSAAI